MNKKEQILKLAKKGPLKSSHLVKHLKVSRQTVASYLRNLVAEGRLEKKGSTHSAVYFAPRGKIKPLVYPELRLIKKLSGLEEDRVFGEIERKLGLKARLSKSVYGIASYAFTEMLNNAIDHSQSDQTTIQVKVTDRDFQFTVRDFGIGIFKNIQDFFKLPDELQAYEWLLKGKQTTFSEQHSGQGIFFTSKIADLFVLRSHDLKVVFDNKKEDIFLSEPSYLKGTSVSFSIRCQSRKNLEDLFRQYSEEEFEFDKNQVLVKASIHEGLYSRSQARRLTAGLNAYKTIIFDLKGVKEVGQAFVDEVFRVFQRQNPKIQIDYVNASRTVEYLIRRTRELT